MAKNKQKQVEVVKTSIAPQETTQAENINEFASEILAAFEKESAACKTRQIGMGLPMSEVIGALDLIFDTVQVDRAPVKLVAAKVAELLAFKYGKMAADSTVEITFRLNSKTTMTMPENELRELRISQLKHMKESKTDNLYRRIYNIGSRQEYGRFDAQKSMIIRIKKPEEVEDF
jgi:hypothetical protein